MRVKPWPNGLGADIGPVEIMLHIGSISAVKREESGHRYAVLECPQIVHATRVGEVDPEILCGLAVAVRKSPIQTE